MRAACVIGWPVEHSRSPLIHNYWLNRYGISGVYRRELVPREEFASFVRSLPERGYVGANVTVPHKEAAFALSEADERARAVGAVNTLWFDGGVLRSTNTDVEGFLANLDACVPQWERGNGNAIVLGAGGAARAVVQGLIACGCDRVVVVNRTAERAEALAPQFGPRARAAGWAALPGLLAEADLLVNASSLGMVGQPALAVDLEPMRASARVADIVYVPLETPLLAAARARGLATVDGLGMLLHQAAPGFERWFGRRPRVTDELYALVAADIVESRKARA
jgi:shikimate dehydrogenase